MISYFHDLFVKYGRTDVLIGMILMAALTAWEFAGIEDTKLLTITAWIKGWMPISVRIMVWSWLGWHFVLSDLVKGTK